MAWWLFQRTTVALQLKVDHFCETSAWRLMLDSQLIPQVKSSLVEQYDGYRKTMKTGIVLLNFGGPWTLSDVKPFLYRLFVNKRVLVGIPSPFRQMLAFTIAQVKGPSSIKSYESIGGGSPQLKWTATQ